MQRCWHKNRIMSGLLIYGTGLQSAGHSQPAMGPCTTVALDWTMYTAQGYLPPELDPLSHNQTIFLSQWFKHNLTT
jgi:hypothetical protein